MKKIYISIAFILSIVSNGNSQTDDPTWVFIGVNRMDKNLSAVSPVYDEDHYRLINFPVFKGEFTATDELYQIDMTGFFTWAYSLTKDNTSMDGYNVQSRTDKSYQLFQDRQAFLFSHTKLHSKSPFLKHGIGWQAGWRRVGMTDYGLLDPGLTTPVHHPDPGPFAYRTVMNGGLNGYLIANLGKYFSARAGIQANALLSFSRYGFSVMPEALIRMKLWRLGIQAGVAYDYTYMMNPTHKAYSKEPAKKTGVINGIQTEILIGFDISKNS